MGDKVAIKKGENNVNYYDFFFLFNVNFLLFKILSNKIFLKIFEQNNIILDLEISRDTQTYSSKMIANAVSQARTNSRLL